MSQPQSEEWVEIKFFIPKSWREKLEEIARKRGYRTLSEFLRDLIREKIEAEEQ